MCATDWRYPDTSLYKLGRGRDSRVIFMTEGVDAAVWFFQSGGP